MKIILNHSLLKTLKKLLVFLLKYILYSLIYCIVLYTHKHIFIINCYICCLLLTCIKILI